MSTTQKAQRWRQETRENSRGRTLHSARLWRRAPIIPLKVHSSSASKIKTFHQGYCLSLAPLYAHSKIVSEGLMGDLHTTTWLRVTMMRPAAGRYHLYIAYACPWANRALAALKLKARMWLCSIFVSKPPLTLPHQDLAADYVAAAWEGV